MPRTRREEGGMGDWSSTGTFLRKPTTGWLHEDRELCGPSSINYRVSYLGCIEVCQSMRTLQYNMRTQVTKEAIIRMAEVSGKLQHKKKKVSKQLNRLLGAVDTRWAGEVNLAVSAESVRISHATSNREIMNHSLPSISFASGGDGTTLDFIGYVAKDPIHERACHVFECVDCSQFVLTTVGQAFELRYKMYLNSPQPEPMQLRTSIGTGDSWAEHTYEEEEQRGGELEGGAHPLSPYGPSPGTGISPYGPSPGAGISPYGPSPGAGIYSDLPEFPNDAIPSPFPSSMTPDPPPLSEIAGARPRMYSKLPAFPTVQEDELPSLSNGMSRPRLDNPYDTITKHRPHTTDTGVYSEPGEITSSASAFLEDEHYSNRLLTIKQSPSSASPLTSEHIDLTPPLHQPHHIYSNSSISNGTPPLPQHKEIVSPVPKPRPHQRKQRLPPSPPPDAVYDKPTDLPPRRRGQPNRHSNPNDYDDPDAPLQKGPAHPMRPTVEGTYDDIEDVIKATRSTRSPPVFTRGAASKGAGGGVERGRRDLPTPAYDELDKAPPLTNGTPGGVVSSDVTVHRPVKPPKPHPLTPRFDDTIYAMRQDIGLEGGEGEGEGEGEEETDGAVGNRDSLPPDPLAPLQQQLYFHGRISRTEAEALVETEGEFLVRESSKMPGQFVLTGLSPDGPQHLLLMDRTGKVKSRDHQFDSVSHLVNYFTTREIPLVIGKNQVFLRRPIVNAFPRQ